MKTNPIDDLPLIAEIGVNHEGCLQSAIKILKQAVEAGAKIVKFQSYTPDRYISSSEAERLDRVSKYSLNLDDFRQLSREAERLGATMISTPLTEDWVEKLEPFVSFFKIASGDITFKPVISAAAKTKKTLIVSTGAANVEEIDNAIEWVKDIVGERNLYDRLILMHCVSAYPTPIDEANILSIPFLKKRYGLRVGYSNHVIGHNACISAVAHGADIIEVHFTDNKVGRTFRDHEISFDKNDLKYFISLMGEIKKSLGSFEKKPQPSELNNIKAIRKGLVASRTLRKGSILRESDIMYARPEQDYSSEDLGKLIGKKLLRDIKKGIAISKSDT